MSTHATSNRPTRVMIVDDSAVIRAVIERILRSDPRVEVCGFAPNGEQAVKTISVCNPDIIILDIEMPIMDGITALPLLLQKKPDVKVLICSTLSDRGASVSIKALSLGAADCILKPTGADAIRQNELFHENLLHLIHQIGGDMMQAKPAASSLPLNVVAPSRKFQPQVVAIGSSTGGPNALAALLKQLKRFPLPIVITQHMPGTFTKILAAHLASHAQIDCVEAQHGMKIEPGRVYIAPGGFHMTFKQTPSGVEVALNNGPMENFCKPAVDPMLRSLTQVYGGNVLTVILTGMGEDGLAGCRSIIEKGGQVIAQDAATSVVWGMPGAVAKAGLCQAILPLNAMSEAIYKLCGISSLKPIFEKIGGHK